MEFPLVTNAIPLYRSKPFVDIIIANIDAIDYPNIEILISDRHQYDDAIDILAARYHHDPRVIILKGKDALTYAQHYNLLLSSGKGRYFRWMPHDDSYPRCALKAKVEILENNPQYVLVNGPWHILDAHENVVAVRHPRKSPLGRWSYETSLLVAFSDYEAHAFKGLFRREIAIQRGIFLFDTQRIISPERCWEFAMSLTGEFYNYHDFAYYKRYYPGSTHHTWRQRWKPVDVFFNCAYKFRYQWSLDRKPLRVLVFLLCMFPLSLKQVVADHLKGRWKKYARRFPGRVVKTLLKRGLSKI